MKNIAIATIHSWNISLAKEWAASKDGEVRSIKDNI